MKQRIFSLFDYVVFFTILSALIFSTIMLVILYNEDTKTMNIEPLFKGEPIREEFLTDEAEAEVEEALNAMPVKIFESSIGVAELFECNLTDDELIAYYEENKPNYIDGYEEPVYIRCTGYCDYGYTKSGEYVYTNGGSSYYLNWSVAGGFFAIDDEERYSVYDLKKSGS